MSRARKTHTATALVLCAEYAISARTTSAACRRETVENLTASLADLFAQEDPNFDRAYFYRISLGRTTVRPQPMFEVVGTYIATEV